MLIITPENIFYQIKLLKMYKNILKKIIKKKKEKIDSQKKKFKYDFDKKTY